MVAQPAQAYDSNYDAEIRSYLFKRGKVYGGDLKAIDVQRGRDHGLPSYNDLRNFCGLPRASKWEDFSDHIPLAVNIYDYYDSLMIILVFSAGH